MKQDDKHEFTERDTHNWQVQKKRAIHKRPELTVAQRIKFLELLSQMASSRTIERTLGLSTNDIEHYKKLLDVESQDEARRLLRTMKREDADKREANILEQTAKVRDATEVANQRLQELENNRMLAKEIEPKPRPNINEVRQEDAERQRRHEKSQEKIVDPKKMWRLPIDSHESIDRFKREIVNRGFAFLQKKYGATVSQVKAEATRLGLSIKWDSVRR